MAKGALVEQITRENQKNSPVVEHLQTQVANAIVLYTNYKHYHWQTFGPLFRDLHKLFDTLATEVLATSDELAERVRMIGQDPPAGLREIQERCSVKPTAKAKTMREMVEEANANTMIVIKEMRDAAREADDHDDPGTTDLFAKSVQIHEKHEWFLRQILKKGDGLTA
jgi:starvation-inducible DNA-binding protein